MVAWLADPTLVSGALLPECDLRGTNVVTVNTPRTFPEIASKADWQERANAIRTQVLVSAGLWPMPERGPIKATIFGRTEYQNFSIEKVYFESVPGFNLCGSLYRPLGKGNGPHPAVLNPHGHWKNGRLEDSTNCSHAARCITQARLGMVAFSYDMPGYNDTQIAPPPGVTNYRAHYAFTKNATNLLWAIHPMGLLTWDSLRALDFLCGLPDVDTNRLACTGESGGGTQTFLLGAVDDRLSVLAPTVMVSHSMQGGCTCENMPGLRIEYNNMEIAATAAPRPQIFMSATGDWTKAFMTVEGPAIRSVYDLFRAGDRVRYKVLPYKHNYNQETREHVAAFFAQYLLRQPARESIPELPYPPVDSLNLRVFSEAQMPTNLATETQLANHFKQAARAHFASLLPNNAVELERYCQIMRPAWQHTLQVESPKDKLRVVVQEKKEHGAHTLTRAWIGRDGRGDRVPVHLYVPQKAKQILVTAVLAHPKGHAGVVNPQGTPAGILRALLDKGVTVVVPDLYQTGTVFDAAKAAIRTNQADLLFTTYNRTDAQERVQDLVTACAFARMQDGNESQVVLVGVERAGLWAMLAAPAADTLIADVNAMDLDDESALLTSDIFVPGLLRMGGFQSILLLTAPRPVMLYNTAKNFSMPQISPVYEKLGAKRGIRPHPRIPPDNELAALVVSLGRRSN